jgi:hypothetical protein
VEVSVWNSKPKHLGVRPSVRQRIVSKRLSRRWLEAARAGGEVDD